MASEWITFDEAADLLRTTVGQLAEDLSRGGVLLVHGQLSPSVELAPAWPNVRVRHAWKHSDSGRARANGFDEVNLRSRSLGHFRATHVLAADLEVWAASSAAMIVSSCKVCGGRRWIPSRPPLRSMDPCPMCNADGRRR